MNHRFTLSPFQRHQQSIGKSGHQNAVILTTLPMNSPRACVSLPVKMLIRRTTHGQSVVTITAICKSKAPNNA